MREAFDHYLATAVHLDEVAGSAPFPGTCVRGATYGFDFEGRHFDVHLSSTRAAVPLTLVTDEAATRDEKNAEDDRPTRARAEGGTMTDNGKGVSTVRTKWRRVGNVLIRLDGNTARILKVDGVPYMDRQTAMGQRILAALVRRRGFEALNADCYKTELKGRGDTANSFHRAMSDFSRDYGRVLTLRRQRGIGYFLDRVEDAPQEAAT